LHPSYAAVFVALWIIYPLIKTINKDLPSSSSGNIPNSSDTVSMFSSPRSLVFILVLEILFIHLRFDPTIKGIKVVKNNVKLTSYQDDASYFMKDKISAETLLLAIEKFSKLSGLENMRHFVVYQ
jgi:hypothetical protein